MAENQTSADHQIRTTPAPAPSPPAARRRRGPTVTGRVRVLVAAGILLVVAVAATSLVALNTMRAGMRHLIELENARDQIDRFGHVVAEVRTEVDRLILAPSAQATDGSSSITLRYVGAVNQSLSTVQRASVPDAVHEQVAQLAEPISNYLSQVAELAANPPAPADAEAALAPIDALREGLIDRQVQIISDLDRLILEQQRRTDPTFGRMVAVLGGLFLLSVLLLAGTAHLLARSLRRSLAGVAAVARRIARGDLAARVDITSDDELGTVATAINEMAGDLQAVVRQMEAAAERDGFGSQLSEALEMADSEAEALQVVERAMQAVAASPTEMLLADSSKAHLHRAAEHPAAGAPCCPVESPFACVAVRRGNAVVFDTSEALNSCPKLRGRTAGPISAVCVPVTFMGRALGVIHSTGPDRVPHPPNVVAKLTTLATQAGGRIGTVRSFERSQVQATTDGLTGLLNRRTVETEIRRLVSTGTPVSFVMGDLDHFKLLNDAYGHEAGDRALRRFARVLQTSLRETDIAGRFGGEEFVIAMPGTTVTAAVEVLDRLREKLAEETDGDGNPSFTVSFGVVGSTGGESFDDLLHAADAALYMAKDQGRDRVVVAAGELLPARATSSGDGAPLRDGVFQRAAAHDDPMPGLIAR